MSVASHPTASEAGFRHEAWVYRGDDEFVDGALDYLREGIAAGDRILAAVSAPKIRLLRSALGADASEVAFADMAVLGANPGRLIPAYRDFVTAAPGRALRRIGEPIGPERRGQELVECHRHESLCNLAFADSADFHMVCPYDADRLDPAIVEEAHRTHPVVVEDLSPRASARYEGDAAWATPFAAPMTEVPAGAERADVDMPSLPAIRDLVARRAAAAGLTGERAADMVVAVNEVTTNSVRHGGGTGTLLLWREPGAIVCEIRDAGQITDPLAGRERPGPGQIGGYGLWLANQVCDLVQVRAVTEGTAVRLHMRAG